MNIFNGPKDIGHTADILRAAIPHLNSRSKRPLELMLKTSELLEAISGPDPDELSACELDDEPVDLESLLLHVQEVCNDQEKEQLNVLLNFIRARKLYQSYQLFRGSGNGSHENTSGNPFSSGSMSSWMEFFLSQLPPEQKGTFDNINMVLNAMNMQGT